jgi:hypothetical protein
MNSLSAVGFIATALALKFDTRYGNSIGAFYSRIAAVGALLSFFGILVGVSAKPLPKKLLFAGVGAVVLLLWLSLAVMVLPVS